MSLWLTFGRAALAPATWQPTLGDHWLLFSCAQPTIIALTALAALLATDAFRRRFATHVSHRQIHRQRQQERQRRATWWSLAGSSALVILSVACLMHLGLPTSRTDVSDTITRSPRLMSFDDLSSPILVACSLLGLVAGAIWFAYTLTARRA